MFALKQRQETTENKAYAVKKVAQNDLNINHLGLN